MLLLSSIVNLLAGASFIILSLEQGIDVVWLVASALFIVVGAMGIVSHVKKSHQDEHTSEHEQEHSESTSD